MSPRVAVEPGNIEVRLTLRGDFQEVISALSKIKEFCGGLEFSELSGFQTTAGGPNPTSPAPSATVPKPGQPPESEENNLLNRSFTDLNPSVRVKKCFIKQGIATLGDLVQRSADDLLEIKHFGATSLVETRSKLAAIGLKLKGE